MSTTMTPPFLPKAIVFDLLTALLDSWTLWDASVPPGSPTTGLTWRKHYLALTFGSTVYGPGSTYEELVARAASESGAPSSAPAFLLRHWASLQPWSEAGRVLRGLRAKGYLVGVVTNCSAEKGRVAVECVERAVSLASLPPRSSTPSSRTCLPASGLAAAAAAAEASWAFDAVVTAEEAGFYKPAREAYHALLPLLGDGGVKPEEVLFVAGSAGDVEGATAAGFKVVWHNRAGLERKGDAVPLREGRSLEEVLGDYL